MKFEGGRKKRAGQAAPNGSFRRLKWGERTVHGEFSLNFSILLQPAVPRIFLQWNLASFQGFASSLRPRVSGVFQDERAAVSEVDFRGFPGGAGGLIPEFGGVGSGFVIVGWDPTRRPVVEDGGSPVFQQPVGLNHKTLNLNSTLLNWERWAGSPSNQRAGSPLDALAGSQCHGKSTKVELITISLKSTGILRLEFDPGFEKSGQSCRMDNHRKDNDGSRMARMILILMDIAEKKHSPNG